MNFDKHIKNANELTNDMLALEGLITQLQNSYERYVQCDATTDEGKTANEDVLLAVVAVIENCFPSEITSTADQPVAAAADNEAAKAQDAVSSALTDNAE